MSMSATTMITTYEFLKRLSTKAQEWKKQTPWQCNAICSV
jgi:hypothetical protein